MTEQSINPRIALSSVVRKLGGDEQTAVNITALADHPVVNQDGSIAFTVDAPKFGITRRIELHPPKPGLIGRLRGGAVSIEVRPSRSDSNSGYIARADVYGVRRFSCYSSDENGRMVISSGGRARDMIDVDLAGLRTSSFANLPR